MPYSADELADRMEIHDKIALYVHSYDALEFDRLDEVFTPDCVFDFRDLQNGTRDWSFMKSYLKQSHQPLHEQHVYHNLLIEFDGQRTTATSVAKVFNPQECVGPDGEPHVFAIICDCHDRWVRVDAGWRIVHRQWKLAEAWIQGDFPFDARPGAAIPKPDQL